MGFFDLFKRKQQQPLEVGVVMRQIVDSLPDYYKTSEHFADCERYLAGHQIVGAVECLIKLADESTHLFSDGFWSQLAYVASQVNLPDQAEHCREKVRQNKSMPVTPDGWTTEVVSEDVYIHRIAESTTRRWAEERRRRDKLDSFIHKDGFHWKMAGRAGTIYYIEQGHVCEIDVEMSGDPACDLIVYSDSITGWILPEERAFTQDERDAVIDKLRQWLSKQRIRAEL